MTDISKFAHEFGFIELTEACLIYLEENVDAKNVCEIVQIAYSSNFEELKQKCKQLLIEKKKEIDEEKLKALSKDILFDVYCR
uniref:BTB domain-containing protein n=1 Tax=Panagrolaimus sp. ES5 TaxID=591445 RepID=A0AC34FFR8_9BILA